MKISWTRHAVKRLYERFGFRGEPPERQQLQDTVLAAVLSEGAEKWWQFNRDRGEAILNFVIAVTLSTTTKGEPVDAYLVARHDAVDKQELFIVSALTLKQYKYNVQHYWRSSRQAFGRLNHRMKLEK